MVQEEIWKDIEGYEGLYRVSNLGRVKRLDGYDSRGHLKRGRILIPAINKDGYLRVQLYNTEGKKKVFSVHRLVGMAFIPNPEGLPIINHRDENPSNNRVDNLEWCTPKYNINYGTGMERMVQTRISKGTYDPELCGLTKDGDRKEYHRLRYQKNRDWFLEYERERYQKNRDQINERRREQYQKNRDQINERRREQYRRRRDKITA